ncbi:MAG: hypothetical protein V1936_02380 [Patescibacteria group bacterium]
MHPLISCFIKSLKPIMVRVLFDVGFVALLLLCFSFSAHAETALTPNFHSVAAGGYWGNLDTWQENVGKNCSVDSCAVPELEDVVEINGTVFVDGNRAVSGLLVSETGVLQNHRGYAYNLAVDGNIINNGVIENDPHSSFFIQITGNIENNGTFRPSKTTLLDDVAILNTTSFGGLLDCNGHALTVDAPNILTLDGDIDGTNTFNGTGVIYLMRDVRGVIAGDISELHLSGNLYYRYVGAEITVPKVIFETDALISAEETVINGDVEVAPNTVVQNWNGYVRKLIINGNIINNGTIRNNTSNTLYVQISGNIKNNGVWNNIKTDLIWDQTSSKYQFNISDDGFAWPDPILIAGNSYEITGLLDETKYWRVRADIGGVYSPWSEVKTINGNLAANQPPTFSSLAQYKSDGATELSESGKTAGDTVVFSALLDDLDSDQVKLQVELRMVGVDFTGESDAILSSDLLPIGSTASITTDVLSDGKYHWRARVVDEHREASAWQEFGELGNTDFEVKTVPLYTQNYSNHPSFAETDEWYRLEYANGYSQNYYCGSTIAQCGCAITSAVMTMRYYGITKNVDGSDINPKTINAWLKNATSLIGYWGGSVNWSAIPEYARDPLTGNRRIVFNGRYDGYGKAKGLLDSDLDSGHPVILRDDTYHGHFLLATEKLADTYRVRDPYWYNTATLDQEITADDRSLPFNNYKTDYNNHYDGIRRYTDDITLASSASLDFTIASPAELLVVDANGKRLGKDPISGVEYSEIEGGTYTSEGIGNIETGTLSDHPLKSIWIPNPGDGKYQIKVIGTGNGDYTLYSAITDQSGNIATDAFQDTTQINLETDYELDYDPENVENSEIAPAQKTIDDVIADVEHAYAEGMISKAIVKNTLMLQLNSIKKYTEKYGTRVEKKKAKFDQRLDKCIPKKNSKKCSNILPKWHEKFTYVLNRIHQKIVTMMYEGILKQLDIYHKKHWINDAGYNLLKADIQSLIADVSKK